METNNQNILWGEAPFVVERTLSVLGGLLAFPIFGIPPPKSYRHPPANVSPSPHHSSSCNRSIRAHRVHLVLVDDTKTHGTLESRVVP